MITQPTEENPYFVLSNGDIAFRKPHFISIYFGGKIEWNSIEEICSALNYAYIRGKNEILKTLN